MFPDAERERGVFFLFLSFIPHEEIRRDSIIPSFPFHSRRGVIHLKTRHLWLRGAKRGLFCR